MTAPRRLERIIATADDAGSRLDVFLARRLPTLSRSHVQRLIRSGLVATGDDGELAKSSLVVEAGLAVDVTIPAPATPTPVPESVPLSVLYDDDDLAVVDKPAGMVVHPSAGHDRGTLVNALLHHMTGLSGIGGTARPGIVHRLDRGTSGVMVVAKHDAAHRHLSRQFHDRMVAKEYVALVWGAPRRDETIARPIGRDPRQRVKMSSRATNARAAVTHIVSVESLGGVSLVHLTIGTGRTHQIRVHLSEAGHPVVGDTLYGGARRRMPNTLAVLATLTRPFLHASRLEFTQPTTGRRLTLTAPLPEDLVEIVAALRRASGLRRP